MKGKAERDEALKEMIIQGMTNVDIAKALGIQVNTANMRVTRMRAKFGVKSRSDLMSKEIQALRRKLDDVQKDRGVRSTAVLGLYNELSHLVFMLEPMERASLIPADTLSGARIALQRAKP